MCFAMSSLASLTRMVHLVLGPPSREAPYEDPYHAVTWLIYCVEAFTLVHAYKDIIVTKQFVFISYFLVFDNFCCSNTGLLGNMAST